MEKDNKLVVIKYSDPNYIGLIQNAVSAFFGISNALSWSLLYFCIFFADTKNLSQVQNTVNTDVMQCLGSF